MKRCSLCREVLPRDAFSRDRASSDGLQGSCKPCMVKRAQMWRDANPGAEKAWRTANLDRCRDGKKRRYHERLDEHRDAIRARVADYEARKRGAFVEAVVPLVVLELADGVCGICGTDVDPFAFEVDHILPLARGGDHSYANTQPAHPSCNRSKGDRVMEPAATSTSPPPGVISGVRSEHG